MAFIIKQCELEAQLRTVSLGHFLHVTRLLICTLASTCVDTIVQLVFIVPYFGLETAQGENLLFFLKMSTNLSIFKGAGSWGKVAAVMKSLNSCSTVSMNHSKWMIIIMRNESSMNHTYCIGWMRNCRVFQVDAWQKKTNSTKCDPSAWWCIVWGFCFLFS